MRLALKNTFFGRNTKINGLIALLFIAAVALGCTCDDLSKQGENERDRATNDQVFVPADREGDDDPTRDEEPTRSAEPADASTGKVPTDDQLQEMSRATVMDFYHAISLGDFSDFHGRISKPFRDSASPEKFRDVFKPFIDAKPDFSEVRTLPASFDEPASIQREKGYRTLRLKGRYDISPRPLKFDLKYIPEGKDWKLIYIEIDTK